MGIPIQDAQVPQRDMFNISAFSGINKSVTPSQIADNEAADILNFMLDEKLALDKRPGYKSLFTAIPGGTGIKGLFLYRKAIGTFERLMIHNTKLYKWDDTSYTLLYTGFYDNTVTSFQLNDKIYFLDGINFLVYDGNTVSDVLANAYVPTITLGRSPTGGGTSNEQWNQIGKGFIDSFSCNGSATVYTLSFTNLDADAVIVTYNGMTKTEGTHFTVDRTAGTVNFAAGTSPLGTPTAGTNNLTIKAFKAPSDYNTRKNKILNCTRAVLYGGSNDTRILLSCNPLNKNVIYRSGINATGYADPTYWPENTYNLIGANNEAIMGLSKQYDSLIIHKENTTYQMNFSLDSNSLPLYTTKPINDAVGLTASNSVQIIENNPTFLNKKGVWRLIQSNVRDERNMKQISDNIDTDLLNEVNLQKAVSVDYNRKYIINLNGKCYVYDYNQESDRLGPWFVWNNIDASCFLEYDGYLYFGSRTLGAIYRFNKVTDSNVYYDDGQPIHCLWRSKLLAMSAENFYKLIDKLYITLKPGSHTSAKIYYSTDSKDDVYKNEIELVSFDFSNLDFSNFSFENTTLPKTFRLDIKEKKIVYFQILIENNELGESLGILNMGIQYAIQKQI